MSTELIVLSALLFIGIILAVTVFKGAAVGWSQIKSKFPQALFIFRVAGLVSVALAFMTQSLVALFIPIPVLFAIFYIATAILIYGKSIFSLKFKGKITGLNTNNVIDKDYAPEQELNETSSPPPPVAQSKSGFFNPEQAESGNTPKT